LLKLDQQRQALHHVSKCERPEGVSEVMGNTTTGTFSAGIHAGGFCEGFAQASPTISLCRASIKTEFQWQSSVKVLITTATHPPPSISPSSSCQRLLRVGLYFGFLHEDIIHLRKLQ